VYTYPLLAPFTDVPNTFVNESTLAGLADAVKICEVALQHNKKVKIIILGSESGIKGSFDIVYSLTKSAIHKYVEERKIKYPEQQLICLAPSTIIDSHMTIKRKDKRNIQKSM
jgi:short-subunit dehydrogenase involved in D-alanine esterification of teichoic acids